MSLKNKGATLSFEPTFTNDFQSSTKENKQDYKNAAQDIDLSYAATYKGVKESIILKSRLPREEEVFPIEIF